jgi:hypothetical protein
METGHLFSEIPVSTDPVVEGKRQLEELRRQFGRAKRRGLRLEANWNIDQADLTAYERFRRRTEIGRAWHVVATIELEIGRLQDRLARSFVG